MAIVTASESSPDEAFAASWAQALDQPAASPARRQSAARERKPPLIAAAMIKFQLSSVNDCVSVMFYKSNILHAGFPKGLRGSGMPQWDTVVSKLGHFLHARATRVP